MLPGIGIFAYFYVFYFLQYKIFAVQPIADDFDISNYKGIIHPDIFTSTLINNQTFYYLFVKQA